MLEQQVSYHLRLCCCLQFWVKYEIVHDNRSFNIHLEFFFFFFTIVIRGTYQGLTATVIKQGSNQAIRFFVYNNLKLWLQDGDNTKEIGMVRTFMIGGVAGAASVFGNTPVDVIKTRMQVDIYTSIVLLQSLGNAP